ncbi:MAG: ATP-binding protein, partial [Actinomycetota bacterium]
VAAGAAVGAIMLGGRRQAATAGSGAASADVLAGERTVAELEGRRAAALSAAQRGQAMRAEIESRAAARGLPTDPQHLRHLAAQAEQVIEERARLDRWDRDARSCVEDVTAAIDRLRAALVDRGHPIQEGERVEDAVRAYEEACARRAETAADAARRDGLTSALAARQREEAAAAEAHRRRREAGEALRSAAALVGLADATDTGDSDDDRHFLAARLQQWQEEQDAAATAREQRQREWSELTTLLAGETVEDVVKCVQVLQDERDRAERAFQRDRQVATEAAERRDQHARALGITESLDAEVAAQHLQAAKEALAAARAEAKQAGARAEHAEGVLQERARTLPSVAEAEEELAAATAELDRVTELSRTLTLTQQFLTRAQDTVHRDIAPVIATTLRGWLPVVTEGRYVDATVDPATLRVQVCGPERRWRSADQLSVGTAEQVYLLLRVALAEHLTTEGETSPLLLDDVTVQADDGRTRQLLDLLLRLSEERQIVLFAQEPVVLDWAKERLSDERRHSVVELPRVAVV